MTRTLLQALSVGMLVGLLACSPSPGSFSMSITWDLPPDGEVWIWVRVEERVNPEANGKILGSAEPQAYEYGNPLTLSVDGVTNGNNRFIIAEVRESSNASDKVLYYGISAPFSLEPGKHVHVDVPMTFQIPEVEQHEPVIALYFNGVPTDRVTLVDAHEATIHLEVVEAVEVTLANDPSFEAGRLVLPVGEDGELKCQEEVRETVTWQICELSDWDLLEGVWTESENGQAADGEYTLFARFLDRNGYESDVYKATIFVDSTPPAVAVAELSRPFAMAEQAVFLTVTFLEAIRDEAGELVLEVTPEPADLLVVHGPDRFENSNTYYWTLTAPGTGSKLVTGYKFAVVATDAVGNGLGSQVLVNQDQEELILTVDPASPQLFSPAPGDKVPYQVEYGPNMGDLLEFDFRILEEVPPAGSVEEGTCTDSCPRIRVGTTVTGEVVRNAALDDPAQNLWGFHYSYDVSDTNYFGQDKELELSVIWQDGAGNQMDASLPTPIHVDFKPPGASLCQLSPAAGNASTVFTYSVTASEPLGDVPELLVEPAGDYFVEAVPSDDMQTFTWTQYAGDMAPGDFALSALMEDDAGNVAETAVCAKSGSVDSQHPTIVSLSLSTQPAVVDEEGLVHLIIGPGGSLIAGLTLDDDVALAEDFIQVNLNAAGQQLPFEPGEIAVKDDGTTSVTMTLKIPEYPSSQLEGYWPMLIQVRDAAGNEAATDDVTTLDPGVAGKLVQLDFSPPGAECSLVPQSGSGGYPNGQTVVLKVVPLEQLQAEYLPLVTEQFTPGLTGTFFDGSGDFVPPAEAGPESNSYYYSGQVTQDHGVQSFTVDVSLVDRAGNETPAGESACSSLLSGSMDPVPPELGEVTVSIFPAVIDEQGEKLLRVGPLQTIAATIEVEENEALSAEPPALHLDIPGNPAPFALVDSPDASDEPQSWGFELVVGGALLPDDEGVWPLRPIFADQAGNVLEKQLDNFMITVDFTPPQADCMLIPSPEVSAYPIDQKVTLQVSTFEETLLAPSPSVEVLFDPPLASDFFVWEEESRFRFSGMVADSIGDPAELMLERTFSIARVVLTDLVGNTTPEGESACGGTLLSGSVDAMIPTVAAVKVTAADEAGAIDVDKTPLRAQTDVVATILVQGTSVKPEVEIAGAPMQATTEVPEQTEDGQEWVFVRKLKGTEQAGLVNLTVSGEDEAGNPYGELKQDVATFDFDPPGVLNASLLLTPPAWARIQAVTGITNGTGVKLVLTASERLREPPALKLVRGELERLFADGTKVGGELSTTYEYVIDAAEGFDDDPAQQGIWLVQGVLMDLAGNEWSGGLNLSQDFLVDTIEPAALTGAAMDGMRLYRNPWGSEETGYAALVEVRGCGGPAADAPGYDWCPAEGLVGPDSDSHIALFKSTVSDGEVACTGNALAVGTQEIGADAWSVPLLVDLPVVCVSQIDRAGNESVSSPVELVEWVATLNDKIAGGTMANPHKLLEVISHDAAVMPRLGTEAVEIMDQDSLNGVMQAQDGAVARNCLRAGWQRFSGTGVEPPVMDGIVPVTYDPWRGRPLRVGGTAESIAMGLYEDEVGSETWEFDGRNWTRRMPPVEPTGRSGHAMAWDAVRGHLVIFGGITASNGVLGDTWEYDGSTWQPGTSGATPEPRLEAAMAFNALTGTTMLYGGHAEPVNMDPSWSDTWEYGPNGWSQLAGSQPGMMVMYPHMVYHEQRGKMMLVGWNVPVNYDEPPDMGMGIWQWDGEEWEKLPGESAPKVPELVGWTVAYDTMRESVLLATPGHNDQATVHEWQDGTWTSFDVGYGGGLEWNRGAIVHDHLRGLTLFFGFRDDNGGWSSPPYGELSGETVKMFPSHGKGPFMSYKGGLICPGGPDGCQYSTYNGIYKYFMWYTLGPNASGGLGWGDGDFDDYPSNSSYTVLGHDGISGEMLSLTPGLYVPSSTTYRLTGVNQWYWQKVDSGSGPCQSYQKGSPHLSAWDPLQEVWLTHASSTLWQWDGAEWTGLTLPGDPGIAGSGAYDDYLEKVVIPGHPAGTFLWDGFNWSRNPEGPGVGNPPAGWLRTATSYDAARGLLVHLRQNSEGQTDVFEFDGQTWTDVDLDTSFEWGQGGFASFWAEETATVALAGTQATSVDDNDRLKTWLYSPAKSRPHFVAGFDLGSSATLLPSPLDPTPVAPRSVSVRVASGGLSHTMGSGQTDGKRTSGVEYHVFSTNPNPWIPIGRCEPATVNSMQDWTGTFQPDWRCQGSPYCRSGGPDRWIAADGFLYVDIAPLEGWGGSPLPPKVEVDYVELRIVYRRGGKCDPGAECCNDSGVLLTGTACTEDDDPCTSGGTCIAGVCGSPMPCEPGATRCSGGLFLECGNTGQSNEGQDCWGYQVAADCDDGNPCTHDTCDPLAGCHNEAAVSECGPGKSICMGRSIRPCHNIYADVPENDACWAPGPPQDCPDGQWCVVDGGTGGECVCKYSACSDTCCPQNPTGIDYVCHNGECCLPTCEVGQCGTNGCGGTCPCEAGEECMAGFCQCLPEACGPNCWGCPGNQACVEGVCFEPACIEDMCPIPAGTFIMGYDVTAEPLCQYEKLRQEWYEEALPVHEVYLDFFEIDVREVTVAEYDLCITAGVCSDANQQQPVFGDDHPVRGVTWAQAEGYCAWVDKRLCTAAEHEKAARGTDGRKYPWGNNSATASQAVKDTFKTEPAGSKPDGASPFGVLGMVDNGAEWVADVYDAHYYFNSPAENPTGPQPFDGCEREGRGSGGDNYGVSYVPVFHRRHEEPDWDWWYAIRCCR